MNSRPLDGKVALVTGAGGTMGRAVVRALVDDGCRVALVDIAEAPMQAQARELGNRVVAIACDIADASAVAAAHARAGNRLGNASAAHVSRMLFLPNRPRERKVTTAMNNRYIDISDHSDA